MMHFDSDKLKQRCERTETEIRPEGESLEISKRSLIATIIITVRLFFCLAGRLGCQIVAEINNEKCEQKRR